jgi:uncharacterized membrane protein
LVTTLDLIIVVSLIHIFAAVIWIGGNFFELMTLVPALRRNSKPVQDEIATTLPLQEHKNSAISATVTVIAGPILAYLYTGGDMSEFVTTSWGKSILFGGSVAIILYVVGWYAGSLRVKIAELTKTMIASSANQTSSAQNTQSLLITPLSDRLTKMIYLENALGAIVLVSMILAGVL